MLIAQDGLGVQRMSSLAIPVFLVSAASTLPLQDDCWRRGILVSGARGINEVNARRARLVLAWVTVFGRVYRLGMQQAN